MNFIAQIGITETVDKKYSPVEAVVTIKVEKPFVENDTEDWFDLIPIVVNKQLFASELKQIERGAIIGVKGRLA